MKTNIVVITGLVGTEPAKSEIMPGYHKWAWRLIHHHIPWKGDGYGEEVSMFFNVQMGQKIGDEFAKRARKGDHVVLTAKLISRTWQRRDGQKAVNIYLEGTEFTLIRAAKNAEDNGETS